MSRVCKRSYFISTRDVSNRVSLSDSVGRAVAGCQGGKVASYRVTGSVIARDMGIAPSSTMRCSARGV